MKRKEIIGIDVSKRVLDIYLLSSDYHFTVENNAVGFAMILEMGSEKLCCEQGDLFICFENTGRYSRLLAIFLQERSVVFAMVPALEIKQSKGLVRGKNDRKDARMIAKYAFRKRDELVPTVLCSAEVGQLRQLLALREKLVRNRTGFKNSLKDLQDYYREGESDFIRDTQMWWVTTYDNEIDLLDKYIDTLICSIPGWEQNLKLIRSVRGVGPVLSRYVIIYTENFSRFKDPKKFACYSGVAPFEYTSGSSIRGKTRLHPCANKQLKCLLNMAALGAISYDGEYKTYYNRRVEEGKNKMSTLNIIRNKLLLRMFAVVRRQEPYQDYTIH